MTPPPTQTLRDKRYVIDGTLGEGSQATTLSAFDRLEGRYVAIKRFEVRGARSWKDVELAEREARVLQSLSHTLLPKYIEHFEEDGCLYLVMEKIEGQSLKNLLRGGKRLTEEDIRRLLRDLGEICAYLHGLAPPVVHRDIKPGNVIRRPDGSFVLVDFGAVRERLRPEGGSTVVGTFGFMPPEQFQGRASPASDWYAVGATCLAAWTGEEPENLPHRGLKLDVAASLPQTASTDLVRALDGLLEPDPDQRRSPSLPPPSRHEGNRKKRASRRAQKREKGNAENPIPRWIRSMFWVAWAVAWPAIVETRSLIWFWIILPFLVGAISRMAFRHTKGAIETTRVRVEDKKRVEAREEEIAEEEEGLSEDERASSTSRPARSRRT